MDFTEIYKQSSGLVEPSPTSHATRGSWVLTAVEDRLIVRRMDTFQVSRSWLVDNSHSSTSQHLSTQSKSKAGTGGTDGWITHIGWSCDALYMFACCAPRAIVNVFSLEDEQWNARIESGVEGLIKAEWAPDGRNILCFSEWGVSAVILSGLYRESTHFSHSSGSPCGPW
jgi:WD repeat-containing protein WRAP73